MLAAIRRASSLVRSFGRYSPPRLLLDINIRQLLPGAVDHDKAASNSAINHAGESGGRA